MGQGKIYKTQEEIGLELQELLGPGALMLAGYSLLLISNLCLLVPIGFILSLHRQTFSTQEGTQGLWTYITLAQPLVKKEALSLQAPVLTKSQGKFPVVLV